MIAVNDKKRVTFSPMRCSLPCANRRRRDWEAGKRGSGGQWMERSIERTEANPRNTHNFMGWMKYVRRLTAFRSITGMIKLRM